MFECMFPTLLRETCFKTHMLLEIVIEGFIGISLNPVSFHATLDSAVVSLDMLVSVVGTNPFQVSSLVEKMEFVAKIEAGDFEKLREMVTDKIKSIKGVIDTETLTGTKF